MVNIAFPYQEMDASAMDTSLNVLQGMAERGNRYIHACHSLLNKIRDTLKSRSSASGLVADDVASNRQQHQEVSEPVFYEPTQDHLLLSNLVPTNLTADQGTSQPADMDDDVGLWTEVLDSIGIDMDRQWIETALMAEEHLDTTNF